jgi:hypothetical protein
MIKEAIKLSPIKTVSDAVKHINTMRKQDKDSWYYPKFELNGKNVVMKCYRTWVQRCYVDGVEVDGSLMDISVKDFNQYLTDTLTKVI